MKIMTFYVAAKAENLEKAKMAIKNPDLMLEAGISANGWRIRDFIKDQQENEQIATPWIMLQVTIMADGEIEIEEMAA